MDKIASKPMQRFKKGDAFVEFSDKLGKDPATVSKWVTNTTQPSLEALIAIANALEVPVQELVRQEEFNQEK
ncbi:MAG: helix-turn-helix transcriptional regulator [Bacteroidaceae bacterium]|nr:helix-turn-helix transcriptional regulator [Bacteroidaceae bacterium]MBO7589650.1 helix-turn-helix transcriptional regulator [Bacteroidaceae bacterium]